MYSQACMVRHVFSGFFQQACMVEHDFSCCHMEDETVSVRSLACLSRERRGRPRVVLISIAFCFVVWTFFGPWVDVPG